MTMPAVAAAVRPSADRKGLALLLLCGAMFLDALDISLVSVALPNIKRDIGLSDATLQWLVSGYTVGFGGFLLLGGRTADLFGRRRTFLAAMAVFAIASLAAVFVTEGLPLIASRVIKGIAAGFTAPAALSLITTRFPEGPARNRALSLYALTGASGFSVGLVLSGLLTEADWRLIFLMPVPVAMAVIALTPRAIPEEGRSPPVGRFDWFGSFTLTAGLIACIFGLVQGPHVGWTDQGTLLPIVGGLALLVGFVAFELRHPNPVVPFGIFRSRPLLAANLVAMSFGISALGWMFVATLYFQQMLGYSPLETGLAILPGAIMVMAASQLTGRVLVTRIGLKQVATTGMLLFAVSLVVFLQIDPRGDYWGIILPSLLLHGIGIGMAFPAWTIAGTSGVPEHEQGLASGLITASGQIGMAIGVALAAAIVTAVSEPGAAGQIAGFRAAVAVGTVVAFLGAAAAAIGLPGRAVGR
jgi:EmrB/QacA subfamily drug resistance transporter